MKRFDTHICALDGALQERPEVLNAIRVDRAVNVLLSVIHNLVRVLRQSIVRRQGIRVQPRTRALRAGESHYADVACGAIQQPRREPCQSHGPTGRT